MARVRRSYAYVAGAFHWGVWFFIASLIAAQFLGIVWDTSTAMEHVSFGRDPALGPSALAGFNDEPYADRTIVCLSQGRTFVPAQLSHILADTKLAPVVDTTGRSIDGFRVVTRADRMTLSPQATDGYALACDRIDRTLEAIQDSCLALGFNVTRDSLRIVDGVASTTTHEITRALPVLIVPFWDNADHVGYGIPAHDGSVCSFRLGGMYQSTTATHGVLRGVPKHVRHTTMEALLGRDGVWRNGWYETPDGQRWYTNLMTSKQGPYSADARAFDTVANRELDCAAGATASSVQCTPGLFVSAWGRHITTTTQILDETLVFATNGSRFGLFAFDASARRVTRNVYSLESFVSNVSICTVLIRWFVSLASMLYSYWRGVAPWQTTGIGALACSRTFHLLPITLLPRLKLTLCAFFTVGCYFEGHQMAFSSAWYIIYPGIVECLLFYYSFLNMLAQLTYRRMSDVLFGPTLLALCALHYWREELAGAGLYGTNERLTTLILSDQVDALTLVDFVTTDVALRINGNAMAVFYLKLGLLAVNLVPLLWSENMSETRGRTCRAFAPCAIERVLAVRASHIGGLGRSPVYSRRPLLSQGSRSARSVPSARVRQQPTTMPMHTDLVLASATVHPARTVRENDDAGGSTAKPTVQDHVLIGYEMDRLGYLVFGSRFLLSFDDWYILTSLAPLRVLEKLWNHRVVVFDVVRDDDGVYRVVGTPRLCRLDDPPLRAIPFYDITVAAFE